MPERVAVVTGAGRGIGRAVAQRLAADGFTVVAADVDGTAAEKTAGSVGGEGYACDVSDPAAVAALARQVDRADVLVNNAGIWRLAPLADVTPEHFAQVMNVNVLGTLLCTQAFAPAMARHGGGTIINLSSVVATHAQPRFGMYPASKAAIIALTKQAAMEYAADHIRVNAIAPGFVLTEGTGDMFAPADRRAALERLVPLGRLAAPEDVAAAAAFLVSADAHYLTGQVLGVDGGLGDSMLRLLWTHGMAAATA